MNRSKDKTRNCISAKGQAETEEFWYFPDGYHLFEVVGDNLVTTTLMQSLVEHTKGKAVTYRDVLSIREFCDENFLANLDEDERAVVGECLAKLIDTRRIRLQIQTGLQG